MLYLILPPIIVIATLVFLVYFFSRRFPDVEKEVAEHMNDQSSMRVYGMHVFDILKRAALYILERLAQWFKVMTLRFYNALHNWTQLLREKKSKVPVKTKAIVSKKIFDHKREAEALAKADMLNQNVHPTVSRQVTQPEKKAKLFTATPLPALKNQLEDILVERIAANPRDLEAYERLGEYYMEQGNMQDAKECYRQVLRLSPVHRLAKIKIRRLEKMLEQK